VVEGKSYATCRALYEAQNQAAVAGACSLDILHDLGDLVRKSNLGSYSHLEKKKNLLSSCLASAQRGLFTIGQALGDIDALTTSLQETALSEKLEPYDKFARDLSQFARSSTRDEYEEYLAEPPLSTGGCQSPPSWWLQDGIRGRWPTLSKMAIDVLSIPAMSAEPERVFSGARRTISWDRAQLGELSVEAEHPCCVALTEVLALFSGVLTVLLTELGCYL